MGISIMDILLKDRKMVPMESLFIRMEINLRENFIGINLKKVYILLKMEVCIMEHFKMG
jgi:hypothetical protein